MSVEIYGTSDDLVEIEGDISEEFNVLGEVEEGTYYLGFSDGTILSVHYDDLGMWRFHRIKEGSATFSKIEGDDPNDNYSDRITLDGPDILWVLGGKSMALRK